jgi:uncharacterized protein (DUF1778 family)
MDNSANRDDNNPLVPTHSAAQWEAQGWSDTPEELSAATKLASMISVRFDADAAASIRRAARLQGISRSEFVRRAALAEANRITREANRQPIVIRRIAQVLDSVITGDTDSGRKQSAAQPFDRARKHRPDENKWTGTE